MSEDFSEGMPVNSMKRRVIIINSRVGGGDFNRAIRIAKSLEGNGYGVRILAWDRTGGKLSNEYVEEHGVKFFCFKPLSLSIWWLAPSYLIWWTYVSLFLLKDDADVYHPQDLYSLIPTILMKIIKRKKIVYDLIDFVADSFSWPELIRKFLAGLENFCLRFAEGVIVVDARKQQLNMSNVKRIAVVTNCPIDLRGRLRVQKNKSTFTIYYGGVIYEMRGIKQICEAVRGLRYVRVVIAGSGPDERKLRASCENQTNVEFKGLLSQIQSLKWTCKADAIFVFYDPRIRIHRLASPAKLYDAMMCGTPVLANSEALPVAETIKQEGCGLVVPYEDISRIRASIERLKDNANLRIQMGQNGRKAFVREYNWTEMESRLVKLYDEICK